MSDIYLDTLAYYKVESDQIAATERTRVDGELVSKSDKTDEGSPGGIATLDGGGQVSRVQLPFATRAEALDGSSTTDVVSPDTLTYVVDVVAIPRTQKGENGGVPPLDINGKIPTVYIPDTGTVQSFYVATIVDMLALTGVLDRDRCIVHNDPAPEKNGEYIALKDNPTIEADWGEVPVHNAVTSVNGLVGVVNLSSAQIPEIATNASDIAANRVIIDQNTAKGVANADRLTAVEAEVDLNNLKISYDDAILVAQHTTDIATNVSNIENLAVEQMLQDSRIDVLYARQPFAHTYDHSKTVNHTVTNDIYEEVGRLVTPARDAGTYEFKFSLTYILNSTTNSAYFRFSIDGGIIWNELRREAKDNTDKMVVFYAFPNEHAGGVIDLVVQARKENASNIMEISFLDTIVERKA